MVCTYYGFFETLKILVYSGITAGAHTLWLLSCVFAFIAKNWLFYSMMKQGDEADRIRLNRPYEEDEEDSGTDENSDGEEAVQGRPEVRYNLRQRSAVTAGSGG